MQKHPRKTQLKCRTTQKIDVITTKAELITIGIRKEENH
jgi:hypothetical protein